MLHQKKILAFLAQFQEVQGAIVVTSVYAFLFKFPFPSHSINVFKKSISLQPLRKHLYLDTIDALYNLLSFNEFGPQGRWPGMGPDVKI